jgi:hypothetical protein
MIQIMFQYEAMSTNGHYDSKDQSMYAMVAELMAKIQGISDQVAGIGNESNAFNTVRQDIIQVQSDLQQMQAYFTNNPTATTLPKADVQAFITDMTKLTTDSQSLATTYAADGGGMALATVNMMLNTTLPETKGETNPPTLATLLSFAQNGDLADLNVALSYDVTTNSGSTSTGAINTWLTGGAGGAQSLSGVNTMYGTQIGDMDTTLNTDGTNLQQDDQVGQNVVSGMGSMVGQMVQNQKTA